MPSFDVVSEVNQVELRNALDQTNKEVANRFDFKGSDSRVEHADKNLTLFADDDFKLGQVYDVLIGANLKNLDNNETISSLQQTGLHRNDSELATRKIINENNYGSVLQYKRKQIDMGILFNQVNFSVPVDHSNTAYNQFVFNGIQNKNLGIYLNYTIQNITFFSEVSTSIGKGNASLVGVLWSLTPKLDMSIVYRKYDRDYFSFYSNGFSESSITQNETGIYWGWKYRFSKQFTMAGYVDFFTFPWLKFNQIQVCHWDKQNILPDGPELIQVY